MLVNKRSIRTIGILTVIAIAVITIARFIYPGHNDLFNAWQSIIATLFTGYVMAWIGWDWGIESLRRDRVHIVRKQTGE